MRILFGVVGEGMGHATRSRVVLEMLLAAGHSVRVVVSGRAHDFLRQSFASRAGIAIEEIHGLHLSYDGNALDVGESMLTNLEKAPAGVAKNIAGYQKVAEDGFKPDLVISDFESWAYLYGRNHRLPVISIDNMQVINRCKHDPAIIQGHEADFQLTKNIVKGKLPGCYHYCVTTFFYPPVRKARTTLLPAILRPEILEAKSQKGEHLLVYQTSTSNAELPQILQKSGLRCLIYGLRRDLKEDQVDGNLTYRPFSEKGFIDDLRGCKAVVANGGFTLMSEAVYLHKPMLCLPVGGQFEQVLNARYLEQMGFGLYAPGLTSDILKRFLLQLPFFEEKLADYRQDGNKLLLGKVDELLAQVAAGRGTAPGALDEPPSLESGAFKDR